MPSSAKKNPKRRLMRVVKANIEERREQVGILYRQGKTQREIGILLGVTQTTISNDLAACFEEWKKKYSRSYDERIQEELAKIDGLERQAQEAYARSQRPRVDEDGNEGEPQQGNPAWLDKVAWCIGTRLKLLGTLDDRSVNINNTTINWDSLYAGQAAAQAVVNDPIEEKIRQVSMMAPPQVRTLELVESAGAAGNGTGNSNGNGNGHP